MLGRKEFLRSKSRGRHQKTKDEGECRGRRANSRAKDRDSEEGASLEPN
jgi:hypothetical protein